MTSIKLAIFSLFFSAAALAGPLDFEGSLSADTGEQLKLSRWQGKKVVIAMTYPKCTSACPIIIERLRKVQKKLDEKKQEAEFVLVSLDTVSESAERLAEYREHMDLTRKNWHFVFGKEKDVRHLSNILNIRYWRNPKSSDISHDNVILLINEKGAVETRLEGLDASLEKLF